MQIRMCAQNQLLQRPFYICQTHMQIHTQKIYMHHRISYYSVPCTYVKDLCRYVCTRHMCVIESDFIASLLHTSKTYVDASVEDVYVSWNQLLQRPFYICKRLMQICMCAQNLILWRPFYIRQRHMQMHLQKIYMRHRINYYTVPSSYVEDTHMQKTSVDTSVEDICASQNQLLQRPFYICRRRVQVRMQKIYVDTYVQDICVKNKLPQRPFFICTRHTYVEDICRYICRRHMCVIESATVASPLRM